MNVLALLRRVMIAVALIAGARLLPGAWADLCGYVLLGVLPGFIAVDATLPRTPPLLRWALALAIGPLVTAGAGAAITTWFAYDVAGAARMLDTAIPFAWAIGGAFTPRPVPESMLDTPAPPAVLWIALGLAAAVGLTPVLNTFIAIRGDSWTHGAIALRILEAGIPPEDPRFAGIPLHYVWFYNLFVAMLGALRGHAPFGFMVMLNAAIAFATVALSGVIAAELWKRREAAIGAAVLAVVGFNAGAWLLWPLNLGRALIGEVRGMPGIVRELKGIEIGHARVIYSLSAPLAHMTSLLDKLLVGSPMAFGYLLMIVHLWAAVRWLERGGAAHLVWIAAAAAGMMLIHGVVGLSIIPVWIGALLLAWLLRGRWPWLPAAGRLAGAAGATLLGGIVTAPYMISVASGWAPGQSGLQHRYLSPDPVMLWTIATSCGVALWFARRPLLEAWRERSPVIAVVGLYTIAMIVFACVVRLPEDNQMKFAYEVFVPALVLGAAAFWSTCTARGGIARAVLVAYVLLFPVAITLHGYLADPGRRIDRSVIEMKGEEALERWIREQTPREAIVVDAGFRDLLMVRGRRALYLGTPKGPAWAAFPLDQVVERRRVVADLYGAAADLPADAEAMARFGRPIYIVFRPDDDARTAAAWRAVASDRSRFEPLYAEDGYRVVRLLVAGKGA